MNDKKCDRLVLAVKIWRVCNRIFGPVFILMGLGNVLFYIAGVTEEISMWWLFSTIGVTLMGIIFLAISFQHKFWNEIFADIEKKRKMNNYGDFM